MVVDDFDFVGIGFSPFKAYSPLCVDPNAVLTLSVAMQRFQAIAERMNQVRQQTSCIDRPEFAESGPLNRTVPFAALAMENAFRFSITKTFDHTSSVSRGTVSRLCRECEAASRLQKFSFTKPMCADDQPEGESCRYLQHLLDSSLRYASLRMTPSVEIKLTPKGSHSERRPLAPASRRSEESRCSQRHNCPIGAQESPSVFPSLPPNPSIQDSSLRSARSFSRESIL